MLFFRLEILQEAVKLKPSFADAHLNQGNVYKAMGMLQEAVACYQRALQARPDYAMAYGMHICFILRVRMYGRFGLCPTTTMLIVGKPFSWS